MSFICLLLYITAIYIRPQEWVPAVYGWPLINVLAIATAFFLFFEVSSRGWARVKEAPNMLLLGFFGCVLMSHISHGYFAGMTDSIDKFAPNVIMFFLFVNVLVTEKRIKITIWVLIILTVILAVQGIQQYHDGIGWAGQKPIFDSSRGGNRITWIGIFNDPNDLALAFAVAIGFLTALLFGQTGVVIKVISCGFLAVLGRALYLTNSRGGAVATGACVASYFLVKMRNKRLAATISLLMLFVLVFVGPAKLAHEASAEGRIEAWYAGFEMLKGAPLFGVGYGMFTDYHERTAHNSYILTAAENGVIGLFFWMGLIYMAIAGLMKLVERVEPFRPYWTGTFAAFTGMLAAAYFLSRSYVAPFYVMTSLAAAEGYVHLSPDEYQFTPLDRKKVAWLTVGILAVMWVSMKVALVTGGGE